MDENVRVQLTDVNIDVTEAMDRMMGNEALFMKMLKKFLEDGSFLRLKVSWEGGDCRQSFAEAHTLKGLSGNLALKGIYDISCELVELLRNLQPEVIDEATKERIRTVIGKLEKEYMQVVEVIGRLA